MNKYFIHLIFQNNFQNNFFNFGENKFKINLIFQNFYFFKNFYNFLFIKNNNFNILIKNSKFKYILNSSNIFLNSPLTLNSLLLQENNVYESITATNGAGIFFNSQGDHIVKFCTFINCRASNHGGGIYSLSLNFNCNFCCFFLCSQGISHYGASIYCNSNGNHSTNLISSLMCPIINESPWHDQILFWGGYYYFRNINTSSCGANWNAGIDHLSCLNGSLKFIITTKNKAGNSIGFYETSSIGENSHVSFINNTATRGLIYLANTYITLSDSIFIKIIGNIGILHWPSSSFKLINCYFDLNPNLGTGITQTINCQYNLNSINSIKISEIYTGYCNGIFYSCPTINYKKNIRISQLFLSQIIICHL